MKVKFKVDEKKTTLNIPQQTPLLWVLREECGRSGVKFGCGKGLCGACTVEVDGQAIRSCITPVSSVDNKTIKTIMASDPIKARVQKAWIELNVAQCGYCQSGQIVAATALLKQFPKPTDQQISSYMSGNICRCGTYPRIRKAIKMASETTTKKR
jgi:isoquinoline 1-oxidoreductase subunit alpha